MNITQVKQDLSKPNLFINNKIPNLLERRLLTEKIIKIAFAILTLGVSLLIEYGINEFRSKLLCRALLPAAFEREEERLRCDVLKQSLLENFPESALVSLQTKDHRVLEAMEFNLQPNRNKWILRFCGNGEEYASAAKHSIQFAKDVGANLLLFNYRGVGRSDKRRPSGPKDLSLDGVAAVEYLRLRKKCRQEDILLHGFSLGGIIATATAENYPQINLYHDRSPSSGALAVRHLFGGKLGLILYIVVKILRVDINVAAKWRKINPEQKISSFHRYDGVVKYQASLYKYFKNELKKNAQNRVLRADGKIGLKDELKPSHVKIYNSFGLVNKREEIRHYQKTANFTPLYHIDNHVCPLQKLDQNAYNAVVRESKKLLSRA